MKKILKYLINKIDETCDMELCSVFAFSFAITIALVAVIISKILWVFLIFPVLFILFFAICIIVALLFSAVIPKIWHFFADQWGRIVDWAS